MRTNEQPTVTETDGRTRYDHPAYGQVTVGRVSGHSELFDSSFKHQHFIALRIRHAHKYDDGVSSHIMGDDELVEVYLSESQFARMITSIGMGSGTACTLNRVSGKGMPGLDREDKLNTHREMVKDKLADAMTTQKDVVKQLEEWRAAKKRPTLKEMDSLIRKTSLNAHQFESNMEFFAQVFEEHMEDVVSEAKCEIEAHMLISADRLGVNQDSLNIDFNGDDSNAEQTD
jgi:hypothetical protein